MLSALVLIQASIPTVGDTIWLSRSITVPSGFVVRSAPWQPSGVVEPLGRPIIRVEGNRAEVRYPAVAWEPGSHTVEIPGPVLLAPNGREDSLPPMQRTVEVASVLPPVPPDSSLAIQPEAGLVRRETVSPWPLVVLWLAAGVLFSPFALWWRRRGPPWSPPPARLPAEAPLERWADAGEERAVAALAASRLRRAIAAHLPEAHPGLDSEHCLAVIAAARPGWPVEQLTRVLRQLDAARFAPVVAGESVSLSHKVTDLVRALETGAGEPG